MIFSLKKIDLKMISHVDWFEEDTFAFSGDGLKKIDLLFED